MPIAIIDKYIDKTAADTAENAVRPFERDIDLTAHVEYAFAEMAAKAEADHGINEENLTALFAYLPNLDKTLPTSQTEQQICWSIPGTILHREQELAVTYDITTKPPESYHGPYQNSDKVSKAIDNLRQSIVKYESPPYLDDVGIEQYDRYRLPRYAAMLDAAIVKYGRTSTGGSRETYTKGSDAMNKLLRTTTSVTATDILTTLKPYFSDIGLALFLELDGDKVGMGWNRLDRLASLAKIERLRAQQVAALAKVVDETTLFTVTAKITHGDDEVGNVHATFGNTGPYLHKLESLQNNPDSIRGIIHKARSEAYTKLHGNSDGIEALSEDELATEVDSYEAMHELVVACIKEQMGDIAADFDALPPDSDTESLSNQEQLLDLARETGFGNLKEPFQGAWRGDMINVLGVKAPL